MSRRMKFLRPGSNMLNFSVEPKHEPTRRYTSNVSIHPWNIKARCSNCFGKLSHNKSQVCLIASCLFFDSVPVLIGYKRGNTSLRSKCAQAPEAACKTQKILSLTTGPDKYRSCKNAAVLRSCGSNFRVISKKIFNPKP